MDCPDNQVISPELRPVTSLLIWPIGVLECIVAMHCPSDFASDTCALPSRAICFERKGMLDTENPNLPIKRKVKKWTTCLKSAIRQP